MPLILRSVKGSKLTIAEMDGNMLYLQSLALSGGTSGSTNPAGSNTQVQFNDNGSFGADPDFSYDSNVQNLYVPSLSTQNIDTADLTATNQVTAAFFSSPSVLSGQHTVHSGQNAMMIGPTVTIAQGSSMTVSSGSTLSVVPSFGSGFTNVVITP